MKKSIREYILILCCLLPLTCCLAQQQKLEDSLRAVIRQNKGDTNEVNAIAILGMITKNPDSVSICAQRAMELSKALQYQKGVAHSTCVLSTVQFAQGNIGAAIQSTSGALQIYESIKDNTGIAASYLLLQGEYRDGVRDYRKSLDYAYAGEKVAEENNVRGAIIFYGQRLAPLFLAEIGGTYLQMGNLDSALYFTKKSIDYNEQFNGFTWEFPIYLLATIQNKQGNHTSAINNYRLAKVLTVKNDILRDTIQINSGISSLYLNSGVLDSAKYYAISVISSWNAESETKNLLEAVSNLGQVYKMKGEKDSAIKYIELKHALEDSIYSENNRKDVQNIAFKEEIRKQELASARANYKSNLQKMALAAGLLVLLLVAGMLLRSNRIKQRSFIILEKQKQETERQKINAEQALLKLQAAQEQLIQSEKMASLGELTAGIAHEIQNPLNFVNNFSEVNTELIAEIKKVIETGNYEEITALVTSLDANMEKITFHGKRADSIVKSMLQHTRSSAGQREPSNINAIAEEYLRLSYHGMRARDKTFNAKLDTDFDNTMEEINIIPQDIGRVLLNLYNNAFYAVAERKSKTTDAYEPCISVRTKRLPDYAEIRISDNGMGIPSNVLHKIFQPFYTTKPTGEGTGLGLSLSYDIVKAHGGELKVNTKEGEGSEFIIQLPVVPR
jgi:two-component system NtrC family sensor kinase